MTQPHFIPPPFAYGPPPKPKRKIGPLLLGITLTVIGFCLLGTVISCNAPSEPKPTPTSAGTIAAKGITKSTKAAAAPVEKIWTAGEYEVGPDIQPGTYVTEANGPCYWARVSSFDGELDSIIANSLISNGTKARMTVKKSDEGVQFTGRCIWTRK